MSRFWEKISKCLILGWFRHFFANTSKSRIFSKIRLCDFASNFLQKIRKILIAVSEKIALPTNQPTNYYQHHRFYRLLYFIFDLYSDFIFPKKLFEKIVNGWKSLTVFVQISIFSRVLNTKFYRHFCNSCIDAGARRCNQNMLFIQVFLSG